MTYSRESAGFTEFLQAEQSLPIFGARAALSRAGVAATAAAEADRDVRLWRLRSEAAAARCSTGRGAGAAASRHRRKWREVERLIEILRTREREGEGSRFDRLRAEQELRDTRQLVTSAAVSVAEARAMLAGMLPRDIASDDGLHGGPDPQQAASAAARRADRQSDIARGQNCGRCSSWRSARRSKPTRLAAHDCPSPNVFGGLKRADDASGRETGGVFGLSVAVPLFDAGGREAARWTAERARVEAERASIEYRIRSEIAGASEVLALRQAALAQEQQGAAEELVQIAEVAYREGEVGILELLDAARTASRARFGRSICGLRRAWHRSPWNAQWETLCGPETSASILADRRCRRWLQSSRCLPQRRRKNPRR